MKIASLKKLEHVIKNCKFKLIVLKMSNAINFIIANVIYDIKNIYLKLVTLCIEDKFESETIYNYLYSKVKELVTNAIVHKNYENPRTVQIYIYENSIEYIDKLIYIRNSGYCDVLIDWRIPLLYKK
ncbi:MAG TPA: hypothetical protein PLH59_03190 [Bacilli bacterium]|nr:hypothetical protein [Bacilli bacterium]HPY54518.1 hypothetical protein [Bacilli bacterium]